MKGAFPASAVSGDPAGGKPFTGDRRAGDGPGTDGPGTDGPGTDGPGTDGPGTDGHSGANQVDDALHNLVEDKLRVVSQRYTQGRRQLVDVLAAAGHPVSIEDIARRAPALPRSSVYRNLVDLEQAGIVRRVAATDEYSRYELAEGITHHHHHLVCTVCGRVTDVTPPPQFERAMAGYLDNVLAANGFEVDDHRLDVIGTCAQCRQDRP